MEYTCIVCPRGCHLSAEKVMKDGVETIEVSGNFCVRGVKYATEEMTMPMRTVTTSLYVKNGEIKMVSAKTSNTVPKQKIDEVLQAASRVTAAAPIKVGDVLIANIAGTGADLVATRDVETID